MYQMQIESPLFKGKSRLEQHKMVNAALGDLLKEIHGFNLKTFEPKDK